MRHQHEPPRRAPPSQEKLEQLEQQRQQQAAAAADGSQAPVSEEQWRAKYESLKAALPEYKRMKRQLAELEAEAYVVGRTREVLAEQEAAAQARLEQLERQQGVQVGWLAARLPPLAAT
jgi:hypothetical protein